MLIYDALSLRPTQTNIWIHSGIYTEGESAMNRFEGKVAIVTGGAAGIGRALCEELGRRQAKMVIVADINSVDAEQVACSYHSCRR